MNKNEWVVGLPEGTTHRRAEEKGNVSHQVDSPWGSSGQCYKTVKLAPLTLEPVLTSIPFY